MAKTTVLIVEDDSSILEAVEYSLSRAGFVVSRATDGQTALEQAKLKIPDVVVLDIMLPILDGLEVCRQLRAAPETRHCSIILLTAKSEESDQLVGFSVGADDYVTKPFSVRVLIEKIKILARRKSDDGEGDSSLIEHSGICIDRKRHVVTVDGAQLELTKSEFGLLATLMRQPGRVFDRSELIDAALGGDTLVLERTIDVHIRALRKKLEQRADLIETVRGIGYKFREANTPPAN